MTHGFITGRPQKPPHQSGGGRTDPDANEEAAEPTDFTLMGCVRDYLAGKISQAADAELITGGEINQERSSRLETN